MRVTTIAVGLLLISTASVRACDKSESGPMGWLHNVPTPRRAFAAFEAEDSTTTNVRFAGAGVAALALAGVMLRALVRLETGPGAGRTRADRVAEGEEVLSGAGAMR